jgi:hypothetical protein
MNPWRRSCSYISESRHWPATDSGRAISLVEVSPAHNWRNARWLKEVSSMNIVYNSNHYHVVEYPALGTFELIDKRLGVGGYLQGEMAEVFGHSLAQVIADDPTDDSVDEFIANFDAFMMQPVRLH